MLSRFTTTAATSLARVASRSAVRPMAVRSFSGEEVTTAADASALSGYSDIDFVISEDAPVIDAIQKFAAYNIGCLVTTDDSGTLSGVISERDYITKVALLGRTSKETIVKQIATPSSKLVTASPDDSIEYCMEKMLASDIRHLPLVSDDGELKGLISIKDLVKSTISAKEQTIKVLTDFALGKGGHYSSE